LCGSAAASAAVSLMKRGKARPKLPGPHPHKGRSSIIGQVDRQVSQRAVVSPTSSLAGSKKPRKVPQLAAINTASTPRVMYRCPRQ
jgi:hypothetical protein